MVMLINTVADAVLKTIRRQPFYFTRYNNTLPYSINQRYIRYARECGAIYAKEHGPVTLPESVVETHAVTGVAKVFPKDKAATYSQLITKMIEEKHPNVDYPKKYSDLQVRIKKPLEIFEKDIFDVFKNPEVHKVFLEFFRSHYRIEWVNVYRTIPAERKASSWMWHSDSYPPYTCKLFLHLTTVDAETGATEFMSKDDTMTYRKAGYFGQYLDERYGDLEDFAKAQNLPYRTFHRDADAGDATIFNMNCFHRAVAPRKGFRDVVQFYLVSNPVPWDKQLEQDNYSNLDTKGGGYLNDPRQRDFALSAGMMGH